MLLLDRPTDARCQPRGEANGPGKLTGRVQLRLRADGQVVELPPGKTTIGSSPRCNVRIEQPGVQPLHCLIVDGPEGMRVRSWVANTKLNGAPFEESALRVGDYLSLGPVEVEVIDSRASILPPETAAAPDAGSKHAEQIRAGRDQARARGRQLLDALRSERATHHELCQQVAKLQESHFDAIAEQNEINRKLESSLAELAAARQQLAEFRSVEASRQELAQRNEQLGFEIGELSAQVNALTQSHTEVADGRQRLEVDHAALQEQHRQSIEANARLQGDAVQLANEKAAATEESRQLTEQKSQLQVRVAQLTEEIATLAAAKATMAEEQAQLLAEQKRLAELEHEIGAAVAGRENTSAELYRALLQLAEMKERDSQNKAVIEAYELLGKEHDHLHNEADQLKEQIQRLTDERSAIEGAWQALSAEAAALSESKQRLADENAKLLANLDEARHELESERYEQATLTSAAEELERERAAKLQAEAAFAAAIAEGERRLEEQERRFAEQAQQFAEQSSHFDNRSRQQSERTRELAEAVNALERQLAAADETRESLARNCEEAQLQVASAELRRIEQSLRIQELESQLAAAEERAASLAESVASQPESSWSNAFVESAHHSAEHSKSASHATHEQSADLSWLTAQGGSAPHGELDANGGEGRSAHDESVPGEAAWDRPVSAIAARHSVDAEASDRDSGASDRDRSAISEQRSAAANLVASEAQAAADLPNSWDEKVTSQTPIATCEDDNFSSPEQKSDWSRPAEQQETALAVPTDFVAEETVKRESESENEAVAKPERVSFIEQYSHLLADDDAASDEKPFPAHETGRSKPLAAGSDRPDVARQPSKKTEDEESIEQYMAKLLQRVRGESEGGKAAREQPSRMRLNAPATESAERSTGYSEPLSKAGPENRVEGEAITSDTQREDSSEPVKRRITSAAPATDLGALRALANESARMAISRHELRKLRRDAVTKVIVSLLAGVTSLWLMLDSADWRNLQFITACGVLLVAAYWAGETFRTLLFSMRAAEYEGPEETAGAEHSALPIDVERKL